MIRSLLVLTACFLLAPHGCRSVSVADEWKPLSNLAPITQSLAAPISPGGEVHTFTPGQPLRNLIRGIWRWAEPAPYHRAAVMVRCPDGSSGSGTVISVQGNVSIVITCSHVVETSSAVTISWVAGQQVPGQVVQRWEEYDLAAVVIRVNPATLVTVPVAPAPPPPTARIEIMGFGGPLYGTFRPYVATAIRGESRICVDAPSINGDSGAGMLVNGQLVGVQFGGVNARISHAQGSTRPIPLIYPASSKADPAILRQFLTAVCDRIGGGCQPVYGQPQVQIGINGQGGGDQQFYPQPVPDAAPDQPQFTPQPQVQIAPAIDHKLVADAIFERMKAGKEDWLKCQCDCESQPGPPGPEGKRGERGETGPAGPAGEITQAQLASIVAAVTQSLRDDPSLRGPAGEITQEQIDQIVALAAEKAKETMPPIYLRKIKPDGTETVEEIYPGQGMTFRMFPHDQQHE